MVQLQIQELYLADLVDTVVPAFQTEIEQKGLKLQDRNITDAKAYGADAMILLCPVCWNHLKEPCRERGLPPVYLTNLCRMALGEIPFPT